MKISHFTLLIALLLNVCVVRAQTTAPVVLGYYPSWNLEFPPEKIEFQYLTHIAHAFVLPCADGTLKCSDNIPNKDLVERAHRAGVKVILSLGGENSTALFTSATLTTNTMDRLVSETLAIVKAYNYDGIDVDWEYPDTTATRTKYTDLIHRYRKALDTLPGERKLLTVALTGTPWTLRYVDAESIKNDIDWINVMTYNVHGFWNDHGGHVASLYFNPNNDKKECLMNSSKEMMRIFIDKYHYPPSKLLLGIPLYGREFATSAPGGAIDKSIKVHDYLAYAVVAKMVGHGWTRHWDAVSMVPWLSSDDGKTFISYDDAESTVKKVDFAKSEKFRGIFFWEITQDCYNNATSPSLIRTAVAELSKR